MSVKPLYGRVLVLRLEAEEVSSGGIIIPDKAKEKPQKGMVVEVGPGRLLQDGTVKPLMVKAGDCVFFSRFAGVEVPGITSIDKKFLILHEDDILAVIEKD